jgi:hypothetical protein
MRSVLFMLLLACSSKQDDLEAARRSADKARIEMEKAEAEAAVARKNAETAREDQRAAEASMHESERKLDEVRKQAAEMTELAKKKVVQLTAQRDAETNETKRAALTKQIDELQRAIDGR